jgi:predicted SAM-dependent methyltransferase
VASLLARPKRHAQAVVSRLLRNRRFQVTDRVRSKSRYLDLGCGANAHADYINLNYTWNRGVDICWDLRRGIPLPDRSLAGIFSEHCLEHFDAEDGLALLRECHRVLEPGGRIRIVVPDGELYLRRYVAAMEPGGGTAEPLPFAERDRLAGAYTPMLSVNRIFGRFGHRFIYDYPTLRHVLEVAGFTGIERVSFGVGADPRLLIDTERRARESLYVEAIRPPVGTGAAPSAPAQTPTRS